MALKKSELYSSLWSSCDELRGGMDASQYKDYILVLLFIKYVSDKYAGQPYAPITIPPGASFKDMVALKGKSDIGDQIMKKIIGPLATANRLSEMPDFNNADKLGAGKDMVDRLTNLIAIFENPNLDFSKNRADGDDICRTNRLDGEDKDFGYIVDYKDLFKKVEGNAIAVYTSELDRSSGGADPEVLLQDRLKKGKERLDTAIEKLILLCEPVEPPKGELEHIHYFCGNTEIPTDLQEREPQRVAFYMACVALVRAYANIADELDRAGYSAVDIARIKKLIDYYLNIREIVRKASGETLDLKPYEADMRHLVDTYIEADEPRKISFFDNMGLLELIVKTGIANAISSQLDGLKGDRNAISEVIENNVRRKIIKEHLNDPAFYEKMSALLDEIIAARKAKAIEYEEYLQRIAALAAKVQAGLAEETPENLDRRHGCGILCAANEDQVGKLQSPRRDDSLQHGTGQKAEGVPRIHRGA